MSVRPLVRRAATVSGAALALCLSGGAVAAADVLPVPLPSPLPSDPVGTLQQTVDSLTPTASPSPTALPSTTPTGGSTTGGSTTGASTSSQSAPAPVSKATGSTSRSGATTPRLATPHRAATAATGSTPDSSSTTDAVVPSYQLPAVGAASLDLPPVHGVAPAAASAPAVAPLLMAPSTQHVTPLAGASTTADPGGFPVRGVALALAVAAAGGLAFEHLRRAGRRMLG